MKPKTKFCDECRHHSFEEDKLVCSKGHKPRFYKPKDALGYVAPEDWGWKRRCEDFEHQGEAQTPAK